MSLKNKLISTLVSLILIIFTVLNICAAESSYSWYCAHRKDHLQPSADISFSFAESLDAYYIDKSHGDNCSEKIIYLTFDAGYENGNISKILDVLKEENVKAAFFVLGNLIVKNTDLIKRMFDEGHLVCNHTYSHRSMVNIDRNEFCAELEKLDDTCFEFTGHNVSKYYRPPEGKFDKQSLQYAKESGYKTVFWSFAYFDWDNDKQMSAEKAKQKIMDNVHNGEIMLLHPTSSTNATILKDVIKELKSMGYSFGSLDDLV